MEETCNDPVVEFFAPVLVVVRNGLNRGISDRVTFIGDVRIPEMSATVKASDRAWNY